MGDEAQLSLRLLLFIFAGIHETYASSNARPSGVYYSLKLTLFRVQGAVSI